MSGKRFRLLGIIAQQKPNRQGRRAEPAGGIDPGCQHKTDAVSIQGLFRQTCHLDQRQQALPFGVLQILQTPAHQEPVFPIQGYDIRHRTDGGKVAKLLQRHIVAASVQSSDQLQGNPCAAQVFVGTGTIRPVGIDHRRRPGQAFSRLMVIRYHQSHAQLGDQLRLRQGGNAVVHGDNEGNPLLCQFPDGGFVHAVALAALGYVKPHIRPQTFQIRVQHHRGGDSIAVVVPVHTDGLAGFHRFVDDLRRFLHVPDQEGVGQLVRAKKIRRRLYRADTPCGKHRRT